MQTNITDQSERIQTKQPATATRTGAIARSRLPRAAALAAAVAVVVDLGVYFAAAALWGVPGEYATVLNPIGIVATVVAGVIVAACAFAVLTLLTRQPLRIFLPAAVIITLLSLAGPLQALAGAMPGLPAATTATGLTMLALHLITGGIIAVLLPARARD